MSSKVDSSPKEDNLDEGSPRCWPVVEKKFEDVVYAKDHLFGMYIVCFVCRGYRPHNIKGEQNGVIKPRQQYWVVCFNNHVSRSKAHQLAAANIII